MTYLESGMSAEVTVEALSPRPTGGGSVSLIGVTSEPSTSTYRLEVDLPNENGALKTGNAGEAPPAPTGDRRELDRTGLRRGLRREAVLRLPLR